MHSSFSSSSFSVSSIVQYAFFAAVLYVLAGAPLSSVFGGSDSGEQGSSAADTSVKKLENLVFPEKNLSCAEHAYKGVHVLSREPLVLYIDGFLSEEEARHVVGARFVNPNNSKP
jgi:prolyl 4-hydroxylase